MNPENVSADQAAMALAEIQTRQEDLLDRPPLPSWFWLATGTACVVFTAAVESARPAFIAFGSIAFVIAIGAIVGAAVGRQRVKPRTELLGVRGGLSIAGFVLAVVAVGLASAFALQVSGVPYPATIGTAVVAVVMTLLGPVHVRYLQRTMRDAARTER